MSTNVYVIQAVIRTEDNPREDVLGVFTDKDEAKKIALAEIQDKYAADINDYNNDKTLLEFKEKSWGYYYHSNVDYYEVEVGVYEKPLNEKDINLSDL